MVPGKWDYADDMEINELPHEKIHNEVTAKLICVFFFSPNQIVGFLMRWLKCILGKLLNPNLNFCDSCNFYLFVQI